jgi:hypothetical protein
MGRFRLFFRSSFLIVELPKRTSLLCKVEFTLLQSIFFRQIFLLYFGKGKFDGKKFTLQKSEFYFANEFFPSKKPFIGDY